jgi:tungstate transport system ATP-binding protein
VAEPLFVLRSVEHRYGSRTVLNVDALDIHRGETLVVMGPNGSGKSTLLRLLMFLEQPSSGQVLLNGASEPTLAQRRAVTMCFQKPNLLDRSVRANVELGMSLRRPTLTAADHAEADAVLESLGLSALANAQTRTLSSGEAQRCAIARALALKPEVLLLDEPTANLDPASIAQVEAALLQARRAGTTLVWITHQLHQTRRVADRVALLLGGALAAVHDNAAFFSAQADARVQQFVSGALLW